MKDKNILFSNFLKNWEIQFSQVPYILKYLASYPEILSRIKDLPLLNEDELLASQLEWVSLVARLSDPIETSFFKSFWVPIQKNSYDYFIDLSQEPLPLFKIHYFFLKPHHWFQEIIISDLKDFFISIDNPTFSIDNYFSKFNVDIR